MGIFNNHDGHASLLPDMRTIAGLLFLALILLGPNGRTEDFTVSSFPLSESVSPHKPHPHFRRPSPGTSWQIQLSGEIDTSFDVQVYDIDLFDAPQTVIDALHHKGRMVVCYFSAGSWEDWRPDADEFPESVKGHDLTGWPGEKWLDIRRRDVLGPIMRARLDLAERKRCDGVDPDNVDGYANNTGFALTAEDQIDFNRWIADEAHARHLSVGLKNDLDQVKVLEPYFDWALNEQCFEYEECDALVPFVQNRKAVLAVEYDGNPEDFCAEAFAMGFDRLQKHWDLDAWRMDCRDYR